MRRSLISLLAAAALVSPALAQDAGPLSAIDWLSESVAEPAIAPTAPLNSDEPAVADSAATPEVTVTPLDAPSSDPVGLLPPAMTGLPRSLWAGSDVETLTTLVRATSMPTLPAIADFERVLMLAEADPPMGAGPDAALFLARVDHLLDRAALDAARSLLEAAGPDDPALFRRYFDVTLLMGTENQACRIMEMRPAVAPTYPARIFCLARSGDWAAAALTLNTHRVLGDVSAEEERLLSRFLDPELFDEDANLPDPARISPLIFRIREAIGETIPTSALPLAFAHADLRDVNGWKPQLDAAERLARANALPAPVLQELYTSRTPSASGGVWDRVEAFQRFDVAITARDPVAVSRSLPGVWEAMQAIRAEVLFAELYADRLAALPLRRSARVLGQKIQLLAATYEEAALAIADDAAIDPFLIALARGLPEAPRDARQEAVAAAFGADVTAPAVLTDMAQAGKLGEALLRAMAMFNAGLAGDLAAATDALAFMRHVGLEDVARRAALQFLILERPT